jgi:hypothetical protein
MFPEFHAILSPDRRHKTMAVIDLLTGTARPMDIGDLYWLVSPLELGASVPSSVRVQFDKARCAFLYSWFAYELATLAEQQTYGVVELALRERFEIEKLQIPSRPGLAKLLSAAVAHGFLVRAEFDSDRINLLDVLPMLRNELAHGRDAAPSDRHRRAKA